MAISMIKGAQELFGKLSPSKRKKARRDLSNEMFSDDEAAEDKEVRTTFNEADKAFLMEMTRIMSSHTETVVKPVKDSVEELKAENKLLKSEIAALKAGVSDPDIEQISKLVAEKMSLQPPPGLQVRASEESSQASTSSRTSGDPLCFVLGALGKDLTREEAQEKARRVLSEVQADMGKIVDIYAPYAFGSNCHVVCDSVAYGLQLQRAIRQLRKDLGYVNQDGVGTPVWLDRKKTKEERMPYLLLTALFKIVKKELVDDQVKAGGYIKCGASRHVYFESRTRVAFHLNRANEVVWGTWARTHFGEDKLAAAGVRLRNTIN